MKNISDAEKEFFEGIGGFRVYLCLMILMSAVHYWTY